MLFYIILPPALRSAIFIQSKLCSVKLGSRRVGEPATNATTGNITTRDIFMISMQCFWKNSNIVVKHMLEPILNFIQDKIFSN